jgi:hypothetical protein
MRIACMELYYVVMKCGEYKDVDAIPCNNCTFIPIGHCPVTVSRDWDNIGQHSRVH